MNVVNINIDNVSTHTHVPSDTEFKHWVELVTEQQQCRGAINIRIVDEKEIQTLNLQFRNKNKSTNVLSFPFEAFPGIDISSPIIGDIAICAAIIEKEAQQQAKEEKAHWAHICIHGVLHLLGYNHINDDEAKIMEAIETDLLQQLTYESPYE